MLCQFLLYRKVIQLHIYIFFLIFFSIMVYHRVSNIVPGLHSRTLLLFLSAAMACGSSQVRGGTPATGVTQDIAVAMPDP